MQFILADAVKYYFVAHRSNISLFVLNSK
jgi:hypothetical protein